MMTTLPVDNRGVVTMAQPVHVVRWLLIDNQSDRLVIVTDDRGNTYTSQPGQPLSTAVEASVTWSARASEPIGVGQAVVTLLDQGNGPGGGPGGGIVGNQAPWYTRIRQAQHFFFGGVPVAPHGATTRGTFAINAADRWRLHLDTLQMRVRRATACNPGTGNVVLLLQYAWFAGSPASVYDVARLTFPWDWPGAERSIDLANVAHFRNMAGQDSELRIISADFSTGGTVQFELTAHFSYYSI